MMHLTCTNMDSKKLDDALSKAKEYGNEAEEAVEMVFSETRGNIGIRNILALRGDPPRGQEVWVQSDKGLKHAVDLVKYIRQLYGDYFGIGRISLPWSHVFRLTHSLCPDSQLLLDTPKATSRATTTTRISST